MSETRVEVPDAKRPGPGLGPWTRRATVAMAEALFSTAEGPPSRARLDRLVDDLDDFVGLAGAGARRSLWLCLLAVSALTPLLLRKLQGFASMSVADRIEGLARMEASPLGVPFFGAKAILCVSWYEQPESAAHAGYDGVCLSALRREKGGDALTPGSAS